jgi:hypothetical protein
MKALYKATVTRGKKGLHPINIGHRWADHSLVDLHWYSSAVRASGVDDTPWIEIMLVKGGKCPSKCLLPPDNWVDVYMMLQNWHKRINILLYVLKICCQQLERGFYLQHQNSGETGFNHLQQYQSCISSLSHLYVSTTNQATLRWWSDKIVQLMNN